MTHGSYNILASYGFSMAHGLYGTLLDYGFSMAHDHIELYTPLVMECILLYDIWPHGLCGVVHHGLQAT